MAVNNNGNLLDSAGNVAVDFVWGNIPMQPNDARDEAVQGDLSATGDNHVIAYAKWNGYPLFIPNTVGAGVGYVVVPSVLGVDTATAVDTLDDAGLTVTTASAATNTKTDITRFNATSATVAVVHATSAHTNYPTGTKIEIFAGTPAGEAPVNLPEYAIGTWTVTGSAGSGQITIVGSGFTIADTTGVNATGTLAGKGQTIKTQSVAAGAATIAIGQAVTITPWATAS